MNADVDLVRTRASLPDIAGRYGVKLRKSGKQLVGLCPFHSERTPSFHIHPVKQLFKCHGCGAGGDVFTFLQQIESVDFPRALVIAAELAGVPLTGKPRSVRERRACAEEQANRELLEHFRLIEGYPERERERAAAAFRAACEADPEFSSWLADDMRHAEQITAMIVGMLVVASERRQEGPPEDIT
jgi:DNA primase